LKGEAPEIPREIPIDMSDDLYETIKENILKKQHPVVRPHLLEFIRWLKALDALDVYDAIEKHETVKDRYEQARFVPIRISVAAARGLLKASPRLRARADVAFSIKLARLVLRFENPKVWQVLKEFDPTEEYLKDNIRDTKEILGITGAQPT